MLALTILAIVLPRYAVTHIPGGETVAQVIARTHAKEVIGGDYFAKRGRKHLAFDLVMIKGKTHINYQGRRPVLVISRLGTMRIEKPYRPRKDDYYALTGSFYPADPNRRRARQVIVLKNPLKLKFFRYVGTYKQIKRRFQGHRYILMDGGSSVCPNVKMPTHVIRRW